VSYLSRYWFISNDSNEIKQEEMRNLVRFFGRTFSEEERLMGLFL